MAETKITLRRIVGLARPHLKVLIVATFALFAASGMGLLYPQAARIGVDDLLGEGAKYDWTLVGGALVFLFVFQAVFVSLRYYLFTLVGERVVADLRQGLFSAILRQEIGFFDAEKTGELTSRLTNDTQVLQSAVTTNLSMSLRYLTQALGGIIVLFFTSLELSMVMVVAVPAVVGFAVYYGRKVRALSRRVQDTLADSTAIADESIAGIRTVRSFAAEAFALSQYKVAVEASFDAARERGMVGAIFGGAVSLLGYGAVAVILGYGGHLVMEGRMSAGELTAFLLYTLMVAFALGVLSGLWTDFMKASGAAERVFYLIDRVPKIESSGTEDIVIKGNISFENVTFAYPTRTDVNALQEASFEVKEGEKVAFVGASGAGKSTIAALLLRFYDPVDGRILIDGVDIRSLHPDRLRERIGVVSQEPILFSGSVRENVLYARPDASEIEVEDALRAAHAWDFVNEFPEGLETLIGERGVRLSGGQKQRIAIARAVLKDPSILILDEATSALDVESESLVQVALEELMRGRTTLIIAHRLSTVAGADKLVVLERGRVVETGEHRELVGKEGVYHRLIEKQREGLLSV
ncbi:ATP-binding cassette domain-containing protein [Microvenator marinus]|uniref:ATP-binding cassette domain-containing protein n=1 Tax=Microvenator marinus TaxID=2600177 RepID=A0A5B8XSJ3_9DELT|nr:ABC transporter transmembrane domain-containing protein [Microvenator marinus]QED26596.1 ATP-binding cassette domain-containing protein [Microvenator marinus]